MTQALTMLPLPDDISSSRTLKPLVEQANEWVNDIVSTWHFPVRYEWYRVSNTAGEEMVGFRISDKYTKAHGVFRVAELANTHTFHGKLAPVLSALIQSSIEEQQRRFRLAGESPEGE